MALNGIYKNLLKRIFEEGIETCPRGMKVKELLAEKIVLTNPMDNMVTIPGFETNMKYAMEELNWYLSGSNKITYSPLIEKVWKKYSDDGVTANSAYGYQIFNNVHRDIKVRQWDWIKNKLCDDIDSRQAVININLPYHKEKPTTDFPCTIYIQVFIRGGKLYWITNMRSNDIFYGFRNDVFCFTNLQMRLADELGVDLGHYIHFAGSLHLYEGHFYKVEELLAVKSSYPGINLIDEVPS